MRSGVESLRFQPGRNRQSCNFRSLAAAAWGNKKSRPPIHDVESGTWKQRRALTPTTIGGMRRGLASWLLAAADDHVFAGPIGMEVEVRDSGIQSDLPRRLPAVPPERVRPAWPDSPVVAGVQSTLVLIPVPGSHPDPARRYPTVHAGSFAVREGRTWHAASLDTGTGPRIGITTCRAAPVLRRLLSFPMVCARKSPPVPPITTAARWASGPGAEVTISSPNGPGPAPTTQVG